MPLPGRIETLHVNASKKIPYIDEKKSPSEYFKDGAAFLKMAGQYKKLCDFENCYVNLYAYELLISIKLPNEHPLINQDPYRQELEYNLQKLQAIREEKNQVLEEIFKKYPEERNSPALKQSVTTATTGTIKKVPPPLPSSLQKTTLPPPPFKGTTSTSTSTTTTTTLPPPPPKSLMNQQHQQPPTQNTSLYSSFVDQGISSFQNKVKSSTTTTTTKLPPPPRPSSQHGHLDSDLTHNEQRVYNGIGHVVNNEQVQEKVGQGVANLAQNEKVQERVSSAVSNASTNREYQKSVGNMIAKNTDNQFVSSLAQNEKVQQSVGNVLAKTAGNKEVQQKVGNAVANAATNKEVQKKVASGFMSVAKGAVKGAKVGGSLAVQGGKAYWESQKNKNETEHDEADDMLQYQK
ncbi:hypothetical protein C9374_005106 [Naegleria lovaniensis]|uniref:USP8 dimerisation domain-containing protein n=1 Tax=Naegleria lovaniensis TaxID=51637 RepID=A0AA88GNT3_NAELO|nr:uncharacterized protein C9374_005106 [Naegleria lovaniensis]KAG2382526.1 hypothetical protein C9374_005106 [Naegleria lovaniensis]